MTWSDVDWAATEAAVGRIQDRIFRAAKTKRQRLEPDAEQSARPVLRGALDSNVEAATRRRPLQEGQSADVVHEVHQADLRLGPDETDRAHDLAAHAGVLMAEDVLDTRAHFGTRSVRLLRPPR